MSSSKGYRPRRVARSFSSAPNIDRSADSPHHGFMTSRDNDEERFVEVEDSPLIDVPLNTGGEDSSFLEYLAEERPPHYGD